MYLASFQSLSSSLCLQPFVVTASVPETACPEKVVPVNAIVVSPQLNARFAYHELENQIVGCLIQK